MKEQIIAKTYAKSIFELASEQKIDAAKELTEINDLIGSNDDLEFLLFLDVYTVEEKTGVIEEILKKIGTSAIVKSFIKYILTEKRIGLFPMIYKEVMLLDDDKKGFMRGTIEGCDDLVDESIKKRLVDYLEKMVGKTIKLSYVKNEKITAGNRVIVSDLQLDASLDNQLNRLKTTVLN